MGEDIYISQVVPGFFDAECYRCSQNGNYGTKNCFVCHVDIPCNFDEHVFLCKSCALEWAEPDGEFEPYCPTDTLL